MPIEYYGAAVCRRGHVEASMLEHHIDLARHCETCGAAILTSCGHCQRPIRGASIGAPGVIGFYDEYTPPDFCQHCGAPFPWASRDAIAYHIENTLEQQPELSEGDRRALTEQLAVLRVEPAGDDVEQRQAGALRRLREVAPRAWEVAQPLIVTIATATIKKELGLPPT